MAIDLSESNQPHKLQLAAMGGTPAISVPHPREWPVYDDQAIDAVNRLVRDGKTFHYGRGPEIEELEDKFCALHGGGHALLVNSGTSALYSAYFGTGIGPGDEVLCPTTTFVTTVTPILLLGAIPILCDCEQDTGNIDPIDMSARITPRTKAVVVTHLWGHPADMTNIMSIADRHGLAVIEDCSHAHGATYEGQIVGTFGDAAAFSIGSGKMISGGMAGMVYTRDQNVYDRACLLGHFRRRSRETVVSSFYARFANSGYGGNFRASPIAAVLALSHLSKLNVLIRQKHSNLERLSVGLQGVGGIRPPITRAGVTRGAWYGYKATYVTEELGGLPINDYIRAFVAEGAEVNRPNSPPIHLLPIFTDEDDGIWQGNPASSYWANKRRYRPGDLPVSEKLHQTSISFPATKFHDIQPELIEQYICACKKIAQYYQQ